MSMKYVRSSVKDILPYKAASHKIWEVENPEGILKLDWNEATVSASPLVKSRVKHCVDTVDFRLYPDVENLELLDKLAAYVGVDRHSVQYFSSSDAAHEYIARVCLSEGDRVLMLSPTYDNFRLTCESFGACVSHYYCGNDYSVNFSDFSSFVLGEMPRLVYICNPNNPTGVEISVTDICGLAERCPDTLFVIDEAYYEFCLASCSAIAVSADNLIVTRTFSKAWALANFRIGYVVASPSFVGMLNRVRNPKSVSTIAQVAAIAALDDRDYMQSYVNEVIEAKGYFSSALGEVLGKDVEVICGSGNFLLLKFSSESQANYFSSALEAGDIYVRNLFHLKMEGYCIRVTVGVQSQMKRVISVLRQAYA